MGMQEYLVTKNNHEIEEFTEIFGRHAYSMTVSKQTITGIDDEVSSIDKGTNLVVLYGDRYEIRDMLNEKFRDEHYWGAETVNLAATGSLAPTPEQMSNIFEDVEINNEWQRLLEPEDKYYFVYLNDEGQPEMKYYRYFHYYDVKKYIEFP